ncbi:hypothetical protein GCM10007160_41250 [Litchfieldella qijiaojingensis]|uniref:Polysaccharide chain length determinant N-terminal domain-containing protein n=1 Tax=Litchfieldella qijiaojingensis TaxID=980347 RepID=A0ABQ2ZE75_9GAMM|nr:Wzz/FepE/Etk N-terminal domain-containing protein [Halomonas qijiaojingensis]GGY09662.1 hypothetical protein GCM10007160_41250 [Halomonas qijiaojingensis]
MTNTPPQFSPQANRPEHDDEISLVDLAKIMVKRWKAMTVIFFLVVAAALAYALLMPREYQYASIYNVAEQSPTNALEAPSSLVAKASNLYLGPLTRELIAEQGWENLPFNVEISNPDDTLLVTLSSPASQEYAGAVETLHQRLLERMRQGQQSLVERRRETLERQLESSQQALEAVQNSSSFSAGELIATYTNRIANLEASLADLREGEVSQVAVQSLKPAGTSRSLILALGIVLGGMLAVIGVFVMQFASLVCASLKEDGESGSS